LEQIEQAIRRGRKPAKADTFDEAEESGRTLEA
jgi:hypothetical protein